MALPLPHVDGVEHRHVTVRGVRMHLAEAGAGEPLVLLHGWPQHWYAWRRLIPALAERHRVICPDLRGFGWTDAPAGAYAKEELAEDVAALLDVLGLGRVRLAGHDWGGLCAFLLALRHPERVERLVALGIIHPWPRPSVRRLADLWRPAHAYLLATPGLGAWALQRRPGLVPALIRLGARNRAAFTPEDLEAFAAPLREPARARATTALYRTFITREAPALARGRYADLRLRAPALLLLGAGDPAINPAAVEGYAEHADDMRVEVLEGVGHFLPEEAPEPVLERMSGFLG